MLDKQFIQDYFNADFRDIDSLLNDVLVPIFGAFNPGYDEITLSRDAKEKAAQSRIKKIKHVATLPAMGMDIKVFDVTLDSRCHIHRARKGIQMLIRQYVEKFEGAFIVFHYEDSANRSWRFSYLEKRESNVASTNAKRYTYLCGKQYPCRTLAERFEGLQKQDLTAINLEKAFSVETLSDEFFNEYRNFYQDLVNFVKYEDNLIDGFIEYAKGDKEMAEKYARDYIKKLMGRLVFIQFLQNKAWLKEDIHYTHSLFDACSDGQKDNFLDNVLEPLFFGVFNTPKEAREVLFHQEHWDMNLYNEWKDFPYLNGGLFECDELDKLSLPLPSYFFSNPGKEDRVRKPNDEYYNDACGIFDFFDRYNFTIDESDPLDREIGVDPEMLGKIFENLLEDNKDKGAFYTPKEIVDYMCKEALTAYLIDEARKKSEVNKQRQENFEEAIRAFVNDPEMTVKRIQQYDDKQLIDLDESLRDVKICDPAIGSGAFPMGLLNLLMACRTAVNDALHKGEPRYVLKKEIIQNNIYGVDIEKGAIDIARLRFWLSIVVDLEEPEALPNFDYKFMQGNSLLEQYKGVDLSTLTQNKKEQHEALQVSMFDDQLDILRKTLRKYLDDYFLTTDHQIKTRLRQQIKDNVNQQLHEQHIRVDFPAQYDIAANADFFLWHTWFADVFNRPSKQGFDIVIGNPPYGANIDALVKVYAKVYPDTSHGFKDIYKYFFDQGLRILRSGGTLSYITPSTFIRQPRYGDVRRLMLKYYIVKLVDLGENVFNAVVPVAISLLQKNIGCNVLMSDLTKETNIQNAIEQIKYIKVSQSVFNDTINNIFVEPIKLGAKTKLLTDVLEMKDCGFKYQRSNVGLSQKGKNDLADRIFYVGELENNEDKPILIGKDINAYYHLESPSKKLRHNYNDLLRENEGTYYNKEIMAAPIKLIWRQTAPFFIGTILSEPIFFGNTIQAGVIKEEYKDSISYEYLCGLLNSSYLRHLYTHNVKETGRVFPQVKLEKLRPLPIILAEKEEQDRIKKIVEVIIAAKRNNPQADTSVEEKEIDKLVYQLYGLSEDEIKQIEKE